MTISTHLPGLLNCASHDNLHPDFKIGTFANKAGMGNKFVTIFARHPDYFFMTHNLLLLSQILDSRRRTIKWTTETYSSRRDLQKLRHTRLATGTAFRLKNQDQEPDGFTG